MRKKLSNEQFISKAPKKVVDVEYRKESDAIKKIKTLQERLREINTLD